MVVLAVCFVAYDGGKARGSKPNVPLAFGTQT